MKCKKTNGLKMIGSGQFWDPINRHRGPDSAEPQGSQSHLPISFKRGHVI